jgi:hypothetical protein
VTFEIAPAEDLIAPSIEVCRLTAKISSMLQRLLPRGVVGAMSPQASFPLSDSRTARTRKFALVPSRRKQKNQNRLDRHPETARIDHVLRPFRERDETGASTIHPAHSMVHSRVAAIGDPQRPPPSICTVHQSKGDPQPPTVLATAGVLGRLGGPRTQRRRG